MPRLRLGEFAKYHSSSCAVAAAAFARGLVDGRVYAHMPGGQLALQIGPDLEVRMKGPATPVFRGFLS